MRYFDDFKSQEGSVEGYLEYKDRKYYVNDILIEHNNRGLVKDYVEVYENNVINVLERSMKRICGLIDIGIVYGKNKKGKKYYKFTPFNKKYPSFRVISSIKEKRKFYCSVIFKSWDYDSNFPLGEIEYVSKENDCFDFLFYKYNISKNKITYTQKLNYKIQEQLQKLNRNIYKYTGFTIDPIQCQDFDDALYFDVPNRYINVYITNPSSLIYNNQELYDIIYNNRFTIYGHRKTYNMYPIEYSNDILSLKENTIKFCKIFKIQYDEDWNFKNIEMENNYVKITKNWSYEKYDKIMKKNKDMDVFYNKYNISDSHELVSHFMIKVNEFVTSVIPNCYYRIIDNGRGIYSTEKVKHSVLNCYYTHITSPIRRFIDNLNLIHLDYKTLNLNTELKRINNYERKVKKFHNEQDRLLWILELEKEYSDKEEILRVGEIIEMEENGNTLVLVDGYRIRVKRNELEYNIGDKLDMKIYPFFKELYYKDKIKIVISKKIENN